MRLLNWVIVLALLAVPSVPSGVGTVKGTTSRDSGEVLASVSLSFVNLDTGEIIETTSDSKGHYTVQLPAGDYAASVKHSSLAVGKGPLRIHVEPDQVAGADFELVSLPSPGDPPPPAGPPGPGGEHHTPETAPPTPVPEAPPAGTVIKHDPICCFVEGRFPVIDAVIEPAAKVARARVYFRAATSETWYYVEMALVEGHFEGKLPPPKLAASPIKYYIEAVSTDLGEARVPPKDALEAEVRADATSCPENCRIARIGSPGAVTVFSAATGTAVAPAGFAAGGLALTAGTLAAVAGGAAAAGITTAVTVFNPEPAPTATPNAGGGSPEPPVTIRPSPSPSPSPEPSPSPAPTPTPATAFR